MAQDPSYSLAYQERLKLQNSISSEKDRSDEERENARVGAVTTPKDEIRPRGDSQQLGFRKA